ncbi:hypothetical protein [Streptomyces sp. NPDC037389]|uniref:hypothetical protein n=1 Tax=Streptomyces sp. NPDC037389 TaxID=3155369 RepID=UPI0034050E5D
MPRSWGRAAVATAVLLGALVPAGTATAGGKRVHARVVAELAGEHVASAVNRHGELVFRTKEGEPTLWNPETGERRALGGAPGTNPTGLTDDGRVVGAHYKDGLVLWDADGNVTKPGIPAGETAVDENSARIGADGSVILKAYHWIGPGPGPRPRPEPVLTYYRWNPGAGFRSLGPLKGGTTAVAVNDEGLIAGSLGNTAAVWHPDGRTETYAPTVEGTTSTWARGVSNRNVLVGGQLRPGGLSVVPTRWDEPTEPRELPDLGFGGEATSVNSHGWIAGVARTSASDYRTVPVVWEPHGGIHRLDELLDLPGGDRPVTVEALNDRDQMLVSTYKDDWTPLAWVVRLT